jgi:LmbE family N-acetylglucosaminyl deacetylase
MKSEIIKSVAVIVAHPDDETLWAGGTILSLPSWNWFIVCLCRRNDADRAPKFHKVLKILNAEGIMGDLDDGPDQKPLSEKEVENAILDLLPATHFDLVISHNPTGEYTQHLRHRETSKAVITLWQEGKISTDELWTFAYEDGNKKYFPKPLKTAPLYRMLPEEIWLKKYDLITNKFGYEKKSWEAETTPRGEAFWKFTNSEAAKRWLDSGGVVASNR